MSNIHEVKAERTTLHGHFSRDLPPVLTIEEAIEHKQFINKYGQDLPEIRDWKWKGAE